MTMERRIYAAALGIAVLASSFFPARMAGQAIDPTVEVTRDYEGKLMEVHKPLFKMPVADSLQHFDLEFDYSVYDSPYKGTYDFNPYLLNTRPAPAPYSGKSLWLKAGAGYALQPVLDFVWTPGLKGRFRMSVYGSHRSYIGRYRGIRDVYDGSQVRLEDPYRTGYGSRSGADGSTAWSGYDMVTVAGVNGSVAWGGGEFSFDAGYYGIAAGDTVLTRGYDALDVKMRVRSDDAAGRHFFYDAGIRYRFGEDKADLAGTAGGRGYLAEHLFGLRASLGPVFSASSRALVDMDFNFADYSASHGAYAGDFSVTPRYVSGIGRWDLDLGVKFAVTMHGNGTLPLYSIVRGQYVYPDVRIGFEAVRDRLDIYLNLEGGNRITSWSDFLSRNRFFNPYTYGTDFLGNTVERVRAEIGIAGNIASRLAYDLRAGYVHYANAFLDGVTSDPAFGLVYTPDYAAYQMFHATLDLGWESKAFSADGSFTWRHTDVLDRTGGLFAPPAVSGHVNFIYNWNRRIYAGVDCRFASARKGEMAVISYVGDSLLPAVMPGYADLGVSFEYKFSRKFSLWVHGGNLLDMAVMQTPLYAESGVNFTAGICLNL